MRSSIIKHAIVFVLTAVMAGCSGGSGKGQGSKEGQAVPEGDSFTAQTGPLEQAASMPSPFKVDNPYAGEPYCWIGGYPVTAEQIIRFKSLFREPHQQNPHQPEPEVDLLTALQPFTRLYTVAMEGAEMGLEKESALNDAMEVFRLSAIGDDYLSVLREQAPIPPEKVESRLPKQWVQANFQIKVVNMELAEAEALMPMTREKWDGLEMNFAGGSRDIPETGMVFPDSGFFDRFDDPYLFSLEEGGFSRPISTGLGLAFVRVKSKKVFNEDDKAQYLSRIRENLSNNYVSEKFSEALGKIEPLLNKKLFRQAATGSLPESVDAAGAVIMTWQGLPITFGTFREVHWVDTNVLSRMSASSDTYVTNLMAEFRSLGARVVLGTEAEEKNHSEILDKWSKASYDFYLRKLYSMTMDGVVQQSRDLVARPTKAELKKYFEAQPDRYGRPAQRRITYVKSPLRDSLAAIYDRMIHGTVTFESLDPAELPKAPHKKQGVRVSRVIKGDPNFKEIESQIFAAGIGDVLLVEGQAESYLVRVDEGIDASRNSFDEAADRVKNDLLTSRLRAVVDKRLGEISGKYELRFNKNSPEGVPAPANQDLS